MKLRIIILIQLLGFALWGNIWAGGRDLPPVGDDEFMNLAQTQSGYSLVRIVKPSVGRCGLLLSPVKKLAGYFLLTSDFARVRGYHGPTSIGLVLDLEGVVKSVRLLKSADTADYIARVKSSDFLDQFYGLAPHDDREIDAVSGATRTSVAIERSIKESLAVFQQLKVEGISLSQ